MKKKEPPLPVRFTESARPFPEAQLKRNAFELAELLETLAERARAQGVLQDPPAEKEGALVE